MALSDKVSIEIEVGTLASVIAGLYCSYNGVEPIAVPESLWIEIAEKLTLYLQKWDYTRLSLEDFLHFNMIIAPKQMFNDVEINELKAYNSIYFERQIGNTILLITWDV